MKVGKAVPGEWVLNPLGRWVKLHTIAELEQMRAAMEAEEQVREDPQNPGRLIAPEGYATRDQAAQIMGVLPDTVTLWFTNGKLRCGKWVKGPNGSRCKIYPIEELKRIKQEMDTPPVMPEGFVDVDQACQMFGITKAAWYIWKRQGKVPRGQWGRSPKNGACRIYSIQELGPIIKELRGEDKVYVEPGGSYRYHLPKNFIGTHEACKMFGVHYNTWVRWEREGLITCGRRSECRGVKIYPLDVLHRLLEECGKYQPPYRDPDRPGVYRIPLAGLGIVRREAIIDAEDLPLVEGKRWHCPDRAPGVPGDVTTFNRDGDTRLHQLIMGVAETQLCVSHRNDDPLDCRRENLVVRTRSEANAHKRKGQTYCGRPCTSRFKGVCWDKRKEKWKVYIKKDGVLRNLGDCGDEIAAAEKYDEAARELFGEHARLNFPDGVDAWLEQHAGEESDPPQAQAA